MVSNQTLPHMQTTIGYAFMMCVTWPMGSSGVVSVFTLCYPCSQLIVIGCPKQIDDLFTPTSSVMCCDRWVTFSSVNRYLTCSGTLFGIEFSYIYVCFSGHNYSVWLICLIYLVITHVGSRGCENCPDFYYHLFVFKGCEYWINHTFRQLPRGREHLSV